MSSQLQQILKRRLVDLLRWETRLLLRQGLRPGGTLVFDADDTYLRAAASATPHRTLAYGLSSDAAELRGVGYSVLAGAAHGASGRGAGRDGDGGAGRMMGS